MIWVILILNIFMSLEWTQLSYWNQTRIVFDVLWTKHSDIGKDSLTQSLINNQLRHSLSDSLWTEYSKGVYRTIYKIPYQQSTKYLSNIIGYIISMTNHTSDFRKLINHTFQGSGQDSIYDIFTKIKPHNFPED